jgi:hypothetical protein
MAFESEDRMVVRVFRLAIQEPIFVSPAVVELGVLLRSFNVSEFVMCDHLPHVPHLQKLVFSIGCYVDTITLTSNVGDTLSVANKNSHRPVVVA